MAAAIACKGFAIEKRFMTRRGANIGTRESLDATQFVDIEQAENSVAALARA
jgi:hypothetical protein